MYRRETAAAAWLAEKEEREREKFVLARSLAARRFSARWAPLCSEVKRTVRARLSSSPFLASTSPLCTAAREKTTRAVLQPSFPRIPNVLFLSRFPLRQSFLLLLLFLLRALSNRGFIPTVCRIFLGSLSSSPFGERRPRLCSPDLHRLLFSLSSRSRDPSCAVAFAFATATNAVVLASLASFSSPPSTPYFLDLLRLTLHLRVLILSFSPSTPLPWLDL